MLLKKLILDNYKTYYGHQEIDLYIPEDVREEGKNIILLGGLNGAGKTTILKAILYVLFGKRGIKESEFNQLFSNTINNTFFAEGGRTCSVTLILETDSGEEWYLNVKWYFNTNKKVSHEERALTVTPVGSRAKKHARIDNIEAYNKFIDRIIPYHAAPFFIFDGEEIKDIILRQNSNEMKEAIHKISGMSSYQTLLKDLRSLKITYEKKLANSVSQSKINNYETELEAINDSIEKYEKSSDKYISKIKELELDLIEVKENRSNKMAQNSKSRENIIKKQSRLEAELNLAQNDFNNLYNENILSIILNDKIRKLKKEINIEQDIHKKIILQKSNLTPYNKFIDQLLNQSINPPLTTYQLDQIKQIGETIWLKENNINNTTPSGYKFIHDLSNKNFTLINNFVLKDKNQVVNMINKIVKLENKISELEIKIRNAPESVNIDQENKKIDLITKSIGELDLRLRTARKKLAESQSNKTATLNKLTRLSGKDSNIEDIQKQYSLLQKTIITMENYVTQITRMKAEFIKNEFSTMLTTLFRKKDEFGKIGFDVDTYSIRLYNDQLQEISIQDRSAGEMQMISSALIWALTKASDLKLPIVVDTPLGRLDSYHRNHLINYYYKNLSEQVIILSTDTEITNEYVKLMESHSYKQYMLDYDEAKKYTVIKDGYFNFVKE